MPAEKTQNYSNHAKYDPMWHFVAFPLVIMGFVVAVMHAFRAQDKDSIWGAVYAFGILLAVFTARTQTLRVQDCVIRIEMRMRLASMLPVARAWRVSELTANKLVVPRRASYCDFHFLLELCLSG